MPFSEHTIYFVANTELKKALENDPVLSYNLYWIKSGTLENVVLPGQGLFAVRNIRNPEYIDGPYGIPWDAIWSKDRYQLTFPARETHYRQPPTRMLERIYDLVSRCNSKAFYYSIEMHGGDILYEYAWIFGKDQILILDREKQTIGIERKAYVNGKEENVKGDALYLALKHIGVETKATTGWFEPHTGTFAWHVARLSPKINKTIKKPAFPTSLFRSTSLGDYASVQKCIEAGISPLHYRGLLEAGSASGNAQLVQLLLNYNIELENWWNGPLNVAQNKETIDILLAHGAEINHESNPLAYIAESGSEEAVKHLIKRGAKLTLGKKNELWFGACKGGILFLVQELFSKVDPETEYICDTGITLAAANGRLNVVKWLFEQKVKVYPEALIDAAKNGHLGVVEWLLKNTDLPIDVLNSHGDSALSKATWQGQITIVNFLLSQGADQHQRLGHYEFSPIHYACFAGSIPLIQRFLSAGVSVDCAANDMRTPLFIAVDHQNQEMVNFLLEQGANINQAGGYGEKTLKEMADRKKISLSRPE